MKSFNRPIGFAALDSAALRVLKCAISIQKEIFVSRRFSEGQISAGSAYYGAMNMQHIKQNNRRHRAFLFVIEFVA